MAAQLRQQTPAAACRDWRCLPCSLPHTCRTGRTVRSEQAWRHAGRLQRSAAAVAEDTGQGETTRSAQLFRWLEDHGVEEQAVTVRDMERNGQTLDVTVAARPLQTGDVAFRIPEHMIITLDRVFEDSAMAELLTTNKLSELACLTLYLMYEKKNGRQSVWYEFIKELDRIQGRGQSGAKSPLLWDEGQVEALLQGSPIVAEVAERLHGIEREYGELDTVWFMAGSLFRNYPYDVPTEAFSLNLFRQAFAAVQASVVHLQGVPLSKRFALVPLGPPLLTYSSTCKAMLKYDAKAREVQLVVDRAYSAGEPVYAWCGPQPNRRLLLNYSIVDDNNPYDKLTLTVTLPVADPLFTLKRILLQQHSMATQQAFQLLRDGELPVMLLPYLRLAHCADAGALRRGDAFAPDAPGAQRDVAVEGAALGQLITHLRSRLAGYRTSEEQDDATIASPTAGPREKVAARLLRIEKRILRGALDKVLQLPGAEQAAEWPPRSNVPGVRLS